MPEAVLHRALFDRHLGARMQVLHFAATTGARVQPEMGTAGINPLRRRLVNQTDRTLFPIVFFAMNPDLNPFKRQGSFNEDHLAIGPMSDPLGIEVERLNPQSLSRAAGRRAVGIGF